MRILITGLLAALVLVSCSGNSSEPPETETEINPANTALQNGKQLFHARCASCHMVNKELTGPALRGVEERWPDKEKLFQFIRNSQAVIAEDQYAHALWLRFNQTLMPVNDDLTDEQINGLLGYINSVSEK